MGETPVTARPEGTADSCEPARPAVSPRTARTRAAVVDALLGLNDGGNLRPTARDIAAAAGVSLRTLYVHFDDLESLFVAASQRQRERIVEVLPPMVDKGTFDERLDALVHRRATLHEFAAGVYRAALLQEPFSPALQQSLSDGREALRAEVKWCLSDEIAACPSSSRRDLVNALDLVTSWNAWETLRLHQGLSVARATEQLRAMVLALLARWCPEGAGA